jgi:Mrp family chromosome partitioning ATPase
VPGSAALLPLLERSGEEPIIPISRVKTGDWIARAVLVDQQHVISECFRHFAIRVRPAIEARVSRTVMVTSALRQEGKTTTACNLALALASMAAERRVALVDLDLHLPAVARGLGIEPAVGLERVLDGEVSLEAARICTDIEALDVFAVARSRPRAHEVFSSRRFADLMKVLSEGYDAVVVDTPPVLVLPDVALLAPHVGSCIAVVRAGATPRSAFREMLGALPAERLIGCFLNDARLPRHTRYGDLYRHADDEAAAAAAAAI